jgi:hypothetical protein
MTIDATMKGGPEGDASAFMIVAENQHYNALPKGIIILDWFTSEAGEGDLDADFKFIVGQYIKYARRARHGARNIFIEDTGFLDSGEEFESRGRGGGVLRLLVDEDEGRGRH